MNKLNGIYKSDFEEVKKYIEKNAAKCAERKDAIESLFAIYCEAQENSASILEIHEESPEEYAKEICESLPKKKKTNKKLLFVVIVILFAVLAIFAAGLFSEEETTSDIVRTENYDIYGEKVAYLYDDKLLLNVTFENKGNTTLYLSFDTEIWHYSNGRWDLWINEENYSGGTQAVLPWETTNFFGAFDFKERFSSSGMVYDNCLFKIRREVFRYGEIGEKESLGFAEWIFDIETYSGIVAVGEIKKSCLPDQSNMPKEAVFTDEEQAEYVKKLFDEINWEKLVRFAFVSYPNDESYRVDIPRNEALKIIDHIQSMDFAACEPKNPNTGGGYSVYIETLDENIAIAYNGGFFEIWIEGEESAYIFDATDECNRIFNSICGIAYNVLESYQTFEEPYEDAEVNPRPGDAQDIGETHWIIPQGVDVRGTLFNNKEKISVNSLFFEDLRLILKEENFDKDRKEQADLLLGDSFYPVDTVEFVRNDTGKKYVFHIYENGFSLSGSAFTDEEKDAIYFAYDDTWEKFKDKIKKEFDEAEEYNAHWLGLIHEKNIKNFSVSYGENGWLFNSDDDCFENFVTELRNFEVISAGEYFVKSSFVRPDGNYVEIRIRFHTETEYLIFITENEMHIISSDMNYGLTYKLPEYSIGAYDEFTDYAFGGPINAVTGTG